jgi:hypothetical protein
MLRLEDLIGKTVALTLVQSEKAGGYDALLHGVESGGLWVEIAEMERILGYIPRKPKTLQSRPQQKPVFFIPYAQIAFLIAPSTELGESDLGA